MPRFLNQITENGNSVPSSNNNSITNIMYVTQEEFDTLVEQNKLIENTIYMINETSSGGGGTMADLLDIFWPVGSYYETNDPNFNPNISWGGTWVQDTKGYVTVGCQDPDESGITYEDNDRLLINAGATKGEVNHTLTTDEIPSHNHSFSATTSRASLAGNLYNYAVQSSNSGVNGDGIMKRVKTDGSIGYATGSKSGNNGDYTDTIRIDVSHTHTVSGNTGNKGNGQSHNNIQPSIGVYRWHRTA